MNSQVMVRYKLRHIRKNVAVTPTGVAYWGNSGV